MNNSQTKHTKIGKTHIHSSFLYLVQQPSVLLQPKTHKETISKCHIYPFVYDKFIKDTIILSLEEEKRLEHIKKGWFTPNFINHKLYYCNSTTCIIESIIICCTYNTENTGIWEHRAHQNTADPSRKYFIPPNGIIKQIKNNEAVTCIYIGIRLANLTLLQK